MELEELELRTRMERIASQLLVLSGKGGVGKSTVAANLAVALARAGRKVGLLDVDLHGPSIPGILGLRDRRLAPDADGGIAPIRVNENLSVVSVGLLLAGADDAVIWRGPMKYNVIRQLLKDTRWGRLDHLVIDSPPGTGDEPLAVAQLAGPGAQAVIVTTPQQVAIDDVRRGVSFCRKLQLPVAGIIENMSALACPHCGGQVDLFRSGGGRRLAHEVGVTFLGRIPLDPCIVACGDDGRPLMQVAPESHSGKAFAAAIEPLLNPRDNETQTDPQKTSKEHTSMKIAIPVANGQLCMHFGHCEQFAVVSVDDDRNITGTEFLTPPPHEPGVLPRWLHEQGANVIIAGGMGMRAQQLFANNQIEVVVGAPAGAPEQIAKAYLAGTLEAGENVCDH
jgi:Mrp family chromosome partitioning ATPase/predicted Fe-Mo cluster-binding NifX family protein